VKVFISWSGALSRAVAEHLKVFVKCVIQQTEPFISTEDIDKGSVWFDKISNELATSGVGIICLTRDNMSAEWILFESGALAKGLTKSRVCTLLVNITPTDLKPPLSQFNATALNQADLFRLVETINRAMGEKALEKDILERAFKQAWPSFELEIKSAIQAHQPGNAPKKRPVDEVAAEILEICRSLHRTANQTGAADYIRHQQRRFSRLTIPSSARDSVTTRNNNGVSNEMAKLLLDGVNELRAQLKKQNEKMD
jgi:hypothetical protein